LSQPLDAIAGIFTPKPGATPGLFQASTTIVSVSAIYLYFAGYVYCYAFYTKYYEITLESLDLSPQFYMMRAFSALNNRFGICLVVVMLLTIIGYVSGKLRTWITLLVLIAAFPALYHISYSTATKNALINLCIPNNSLRLYFKPSDKKDPSPAKKALSSPTPKADEAGQQKAKAVASPQPAAKSGAPAAPSLDDLFGISNESVKPEDLVALGERGELALLLETKDRLVLIRVPDCGSEKGRLFLKSPGHVYTLARSDLGFTDITLK